MLWTGLHSWSSLKPRQSTTKTTPGTSSWLHLENQTSALTEPLPSFTLIRSRSTSSATRATSTWPPLGSRTSARTGLLPSFLLILKPATKRMSLPLAGRSMRPIWWDLSHLVGWYLLHCFQPYRNSSFGIARPRTINEMKIGLGYWSTAQQNTSQAA